MDVGIIPNKQHHQGDTRWSAFHITTCHGLRLECSSLLKLQVLVLDILLFTFLTSGVLSFLDKRRTTHA